MQHSGNLKPRDGFLLQNIHLQPDYGLPSLYTHEKSILLFKLYKLQISVMLDLTGYGNIIRN